MNDPWRTTLDDNYRQWAELAETLGLPDGTVIVGTPFYVLDGVNADINLAETYRISDGMREYVQFDR